MTPFALPITATASVRVGAICEAHLVDGRIIMYDEQERRIPVEPPFADAWLRLFGLTPPAPAEPSVASPHTEGGNQ